MKIKIYLASPFFNDEQIERIEAVEKILGSNDMLEIFSPRQAKYEHPFGTHEWRDEVFRNNVDHIVNADVVVGIYDGEDSGTMWELGAAAALDIPVVVFKEKDPRINLMISDSLHAYCETREQLAAYNFVTLPKIPYEGEVF